MAIWSPDSVAKQLLCHTRLIDETQRHLRCSGDNNLHVGPTATIPMLAYSEYNFPNMPHNEEASLSEHGIYLGSLASGSFCVLLSTISQHKLSTLQRLTGLYIIFVGLLRGRCRSVLLESVKFGASDRGSQSCCGVCRQNASCLQRRHCILTAPSDHRVISVHLNGRWQLAVRAGTRCHVIVDSLLLQHGERRVPQWLGQPCSKRNRMRRHNGPASTSTIPTPLPFGKINCCNCSCSLVYLAGRAVYVKWLRVR